MNEDAIVRMQMSCGIFGKDLAAMDDAALNFCPGGKARTGYDIAYEVIDANTRFASRVDGGPSFEKQDGWIVCPADLKSKEVIIAAFDDSVQRAIAAMQNMTDEDAQKLVNTTMGDVPAGRIPTILPIHTMYHSGQLNYIQTILGDDDLHWG